MPLSADLFSGIGSGLSQVFEGAGALTSAKGIKKSAASLDEAANITRQAAGLYTQAADLSKQNAGIAQMNTNVQLIQERRALYKAVGTQKAQIAGAGLKLSGSALDIMRDAAMQGGLERAQIRMQGAVTQNEYGLEQIGFAATQKGMEAQAVSLEGQADATRSEAKAKKKGGVFGILKGVATVGASLLFSDDRLKEDVEFVRRRDDGIGIYTFRYKGGKDTFEGVLAQEVHMHRPDATAIVDGYLKVDYDKLGIELKVLA